MTRHYSAKEFFRQVPNALLARYFHERGLFQDMDFAAMKETKVDELFAAWLELPDGKRNAMDVECREIFEMSCEKGFRAITDEARWQLIQTPEAFAAFMERMSSLPNHYERAMTTFLGNNSFWKGATRFYHADTLPYWRKRKLLSHRPAAVDEASIQQFSNMIRNYFYRNEGRGKNCFVELFHRGDLDYFFAYPEDYSKDSYDYVDGELGRRPHNPAFEVIYVYSQKEGSLDLNFRGSYKAIEPLQWIFATAILKLEQLPPDPKDNRVYDLNPLLRRDFQFIYDVGSGIEKVAVKKLRLSSRSKAGERITVEADAHGNPHSIYYLLEKLGRAIPLNMYNVTQAELSASLMVDAEKPPKRVTIRITHPNSCSLKYDELDLRLRDMLEASGIELKEPPQEAAADGANRQ